MSDVVTQHQADAPKSISCAVVTISDTRTLDTDLGGATVIEWLERAGHTVSERAIIKDDAATLTQLLRQLVAHPHIDAVLLTGGTGLSHRDCTFETISGLLTKTLPGYGELFRMLSYHEIGPAAMLSRTVGGLIDRTVVLTMPGSPAAVQLAMEKIIVFQLGHLVREARR
jgi:molybdenum cofactor biosynthesis protein B